MAFLLFSDHWIDNFNANLASTFRLLVLVLYVSYVTFHCWYGFGVIIISSSMVVAICYGRRISIVIGHHHHRDVISDVTVKRWRHTSAVANRSKRRALASPSPGGPSACSGQYEVDRMTAMLGDYWAIIVFFATAADAKWCALCAAGGDQWMHGPPSTLSHSDQSNSFN